MLFLLAFLPAHGQEQASDAARSVHVIELEGSIGPATADFVVRSLERAEQARVEAAVLRIDTPGGLDGAMREIISAILASPVPVVAWVGPSGARAASAGTYITYASHVAAMAPATNIGSSTPVSMGGGSSSPLPSSGGGDGASPSQSSPGDGQDGGSSDSPQSSEPAQPQSAMERKVINDAVSYIRGLAELRGRNADWAERSVREAANLPASDAVEENVIDLMAPTIAELLTALDGRSIEFEGQTRTLETAGLEIVNVEPDWRYEFLSVITNPNVAYILLMIGFYGLILEFYNPGMGIPGVTGIICLLLAGFALQMLPISYAGLGLMGAGLAMMIFELFSPSFGVLGVGGLIGFVLGSVMLMDTSVPGYQISMPLIAAMAVASAGVILFILGALIKSRRQRLASGLETMVGQQATVLDGFDSEGKVRASGEIWRAVSDRPVSRGERVVITAVEGLTLTVRKQDTQQEDHGSPVNT